MAEDPPWVIKYAPWAWAGANTPWRSAECALEGGVFDSEGHCIRGEWVWKPGIDETSTAHSSMDAYVIAWGDAIRAGGNDFIVSNATRLIHNTPSCCWYFDRQASDYGLLFTADASSPTTQAADKPQSYTGTTGPTWNADIFGSHPSGDGPASTIPIYELPDNGGSYVGTDGTSIYRFWAQVPNSTDHWRMPLGSKYSTPLGTNLGTWNYFNTVRTIDPVVVKGEGDFDVQYIDNSWVEVIDGVPGIWEFFMDEDDCIDHNGIWFEGVCYLPKVESAAWDIVGG